MLTVRVADDLVVTGELVLILSERVATVRALDGDTYTGAVVARCETCSALGGTREADVFVNGRALCASHALSTAERRAVACDCGGVGYGQHLTTCSAVAP